MCMADKMPPREELTNALGEMYKPEIYAQLGEARERVRKAKGMPSIKVMRADASTGCEEEEDIDSCVGCEEDGDAGNESEIETEGIRML